MSLFKPVALSIWRGMWSGGLWLSQALSPPTYSEYFVTDAGGEVYHITGAEAYEVRD